MKVLLIGGTGRISNDVAKLAAEKNEIYLLTRGSSSRKKFVNQKFNMIYSDIRDKDKTMKVLENKKFEVIVDFLSFNVEQLKNTLEAVKGKYKQFIFISTATVYNKKSEKEVICEDKTATGNDKWKYAHNKYLCEKFLKEYFNKKDEKYTIIRPYVTYNETRIPYPIIPQDSMYEFSLIKRIKEGKKIPIIKKGQIITTITNSKDFAQGVVGLFGNKKAYNESFHITSDDQIRWEEIVEIISNYYKKTPKFINYSVEDFSKKYPDFKELLNGDKGHSMKFDNSKIKKAVPDFKCDTNITEGMKKTIEFYEVNKEYDKVDYYWYGRIDKICNDVKEKTFESRSDRIKYMLGYYNMPKIVLRALRKVGIIK